MNISYWQDASAPEIAALAEQDPVAILALGAIEQHGAHLPLSTDVDIGEGLLSAALGHLAPAPPEDRPVVVMPMLTLGASTEHSAFAGTLTLAPETAITVIEACGRALAQAGIRRLVLFNSHGGNTAVADLAALELRARYRMLVVKASYFRFAPPADSLPAEELAHGLHGGALETALMLYLAPDKVRRDAIGDAPGLGAARAAAGAIIAPEGEAGFAWMAQDLHASGVVGDARLASREQGERLAAHYGERLARIVAEAAAFDLGALNDQPSSGSPPTT